MCGKLLYSIIVVVLFFLIDLSLPFSASAIIGIPQTGLDRCFGQTQTGWGEIPCTGTGQDGELRSGVPWPDPRLILTYCDSAGPCAGQSTDCDNNASTDVITDNLTGLMWSRDTNLPAIPLSWQQALDYARTMNATNGLCGYHDWHMPNIVELESLWNYAELISDYPMVGFQWLIDNGFINISNIANEYRSSTTEIESEGFGYDPNMSVYTLRPPNGIAQVSKQYTGENYSFLPVWFVRSAFDGSPAPVRKTGQTTCYNTEGFQISCAGTGQDGDIQAGASWPDIRLSDNRNGTVTDNLTGLMWTKMTYVPGPKACYPYTEKTWLEAFEYIKCLNNNRFLGFSNWRLPNVRELFSLLDYGRTLPVLPNGGEPFQTIRHDNFTRYSSTYAGINIAPLAWNFGFAYNGYIANNVILYSPSAVLPVRTPDYSQCVHTVDPTIKTFAYRGKTSSMKLEASGEVGCPTPEIVTGVDWITVSVDKWERNKGKAKMTVSINISSQERKAEVLIGKDITMTVTQEGAPCKFVSVMPKNLSVDPSASTGSFDVKITPQDCAWSATESSDWIAVTAGSGTGNGSVSFTIDSNSTGSNRTGKITVFLNNDPKKKKIFTIKQTK